MKFTNFIIFRDFFYFFLNFSEFLFLINFSDNLKCAGDVSQSGVSDRIAIDGTRPRGRLFHTVSCQKIKPNLPIWGIKSELKGIMVNKGRIHKEFRYFQDIFWN